MVDAEFALEELSEIDRLDIYLVDTKLEIYFKTKVVWMAVLRLLDENL